MPRILTLGEYILYFWSNESHEPVHVHIGRKRAGKNDTKLWILWDGETVVAHNNGQIPTKHLKRIRYAIKENCDVIFDAWEEHFKGINFYEKLEVVKK